MWTFSSSPTYCLLLRNRVRPSKFKVLATVQHRKVDPAALRFATVSHEKLATFAVTRMLVQKCTQEIPDALVEFAPGPYDVPRGRVNDEVR